MLKGPGVAVCAVQCLIALGNFVHDLDTVRTICWCFLRRECEVSGRDPLQIVCSRTLVFVAGDSGGELGWDALVVLTFAVVVASSPSGVGPLNRRTDRPYVSMVRSLHGSQCSRLIDYY